MSAEILKKLIEQVSNLTTIVNKSIADADAKHLTLLENLAKVELKLSAVAAEGTAKPAAKRSPPKQTVQAAKFPTSLLAWWCGPVFVERDNLNEYLEEIFNEDERKAIADYMEANHKDVTGVPYIKGVCQHVWGAYFSKEPTKKAAAAAIYNRLKSAHESENSQAHKE